VVCSDLWILDKEIQIYAQWPHGLKAEAIADEKWGIATDRLKKK
jgi:hypothetical protein